MSRDVGSSMGFEAVLGIAIILVLFGLAWKLFLGPLEEKRITECNSFATSVDMELPANKMTDRLCREARR